MSSRIAEIQNLIADIESLLTNKRLSKFLSQQENQPRHILESIRDFLTGLEENEKQSDQKLSPSRLLAKWTGKEVEQPTQPDINQQVINEPSPQQLQGELSALIAPLKAELTNLLKERQILVEEIRQLEQKRLHNNSLAQQVANQERMIAEFLQVAKGRLNSGAILPETAIYSSNIQPVTSLNQNNLQTQQSSPQQAPQQLERLAELTKELDQKILSLDSTVNVVFESLQRNVNTYHDSLSQSLGRMHNQGTQGEEVLTKLINNITYQLQQTPVNKPPSTILVPNSGDTLGKSPSPPTPSITPPPPITPIPPNEINIKREVKVEEVSTTDDLDTLLLELGIQPENPPPQNPPLSVTTAVPSQQEILSASDDEVDQLYASLFGDESSFDFEQVVSSTIPIKASIKTEETKGQVSNLTAKSEDISLKPLADKDIDKEILQTVVVTEEAVNENNHENKSEQNNNIFLLEENIASNKLKEYTDEVLAEEELVTGQLVTEKIKKQEESKLVKDNVILESSINVANITNVTNVTNFQNVEPIKTIEEITPSPIAEEKLADIAMTLEPVEEEVSDTNSVLASLPDPWLEEMDGASLEINQGKKVNTVVSTSTKIQEVETKKVVSRVLPTDTITALTDLLDERGLALQTEATMADATLGWVGDDYIQASPTENLIVSDDKKLTSVFDISLDEENFKALDRDLAKFDGQKTSRQELQESISEKLDLSPSEGLLLDNTENLQETLPFIGSNSTNSPDNNDNYDENSIWYLGIDIGTTGISAALLNRSTNEVYPLYWTGEGEIGANSLPRSFRLPAEVYLPRIERDNLDGENSDLHDSEIPAAVAREKVGEFDSSQSQNQTHNRPSAELKPFLQIAIPYHSLNQKWEPTLLLNDFSTVPLAWVVRSLSKLLLTLKSDSQSTTLGLTASVNGFSKATYSKIINKLAGVICTCPSNWSEQYRFNIREALLNTKLVQHPQQVFFIEEAIACLLSELDGANGEIVTFPKRSSSITAKTSEQRPVGGTLIINIGASTTEMALVDLPEKLQELAHSDFMLHSFSYAGKGIEQDIFCQLLYPPKYRESRIGKPTDGKTFTSNPWHWQPTIPGLDQMRWHGLELEQIELPRPGEPDLSDRIRLQQKLESSLLGQATLDAVMALKLILQHQETFTLELADQRWTLQRRDLETQVFVPFVRRLNRELNRLLVARGIPTEAINQAILTGGTTTLAAVSRWLRQKLPSAKIIQDLYVGENGSPTCSRVAYGLAMLPLHPQVLETPRQQYTDYFLFTELLKILPNRPVSFGEVIQLFEEQGINTRSCQQRLLAFLEGSLPPGLLPNPVDSLWLTKSSQENADYKAIQKSTLFEKQGSLAYRPKPEQLESLKHYIGYIANSTKQSLKEPYTVNFSIGVN